MVYKVMKCIIFLLLLTALPSYAQTKKRFELSNYDSAKALDLVEIKKLVYNDPTNKYKLDAFATIKVEWLDTEKKYSTCLMSEMPHSGNAVFTEYLLGVINTWQFPEDASPRYPIFYTIHSDGIIKVAFYREGIDKEDKIVTYMEFNSFDYDRFSITDRIIKTANFNPRSVFIPQLKIVPKFPSGGWWYDFIFMKLQLIYSLFFLVILGFLVFAILFVVRNVYRKNQAGDPMFYEYLRVLWKQAIVYLPRKLDDSAESKIPEEQILVPWKMYLEEPQEFMLALPGMLKRVQQKYEKDCASDMICAKKSENLKKAIFDIEAAYQSRDTSDTPVDILLKILKRLQESQDALVVALEYYLKEEYKALNDHLPGFDIKKLVESLCIFLIEHYSRMNELDKIITDQNEVLSEILEKHDKPSEITNITLSKIADHEDFKQGMFEKTIGIKDFSAKNLRKIADSPKESIEVFSRVAEAFSASIEILQEIKNNLFKKNIERIDAIIWEYYSQPMILEARKICQDSRNSNYRGSRILLAGIENHLSNRYHWWCASEINRAVTRTAQGEFTNMSYGLDWVWTISGLSPMLGLFGTVTGIESSFDAISKSPTGLESASIITSLAGGINEALYTTIVGLIIGVFSTICYYYLKSQIDEKALEWESVVSEVTERL